MEDKGTDISVPNEFEEKIGRLCKSEAYLDFCLEVYGYRLPLFNMMDREQFEYLFRAANLSANDTILDLGCGTGSLLKYATERFGCKGIGIDLLSKGLLPPDSDSVRFLSGDIDHFSEFNARPTVTFCIDSLYFSKDLCALISRIQRLRNNRAFLFYSQYIFEKNQADRTILQADHTVIAGILRQQNIPYRVVDFSENERAFYPAALSVLNKHRDQFRLEGNSDLYEKLYSDNLLGKQLYDTGRASRYLYILS